MRRRAIFVTLVALAGRCLAQIVGDVPAPEAEPEAVIEYDITYPQTGWEEILNSGLGDDRYPDIPGFSLANQLRPTPLFPPKMRGMSAVLYDRKLVLFGGRSQELHRCIHQSSSWPENQPKEWPAECGDDEYLTVEMVMDASITAVNLAVYPDMRCTQDCNHQGTCAFFPKPLPGYTYCVCMDDFRGDTCEMKESQKFENDVWYLDLNRWDQVGSSCGNMVEAEGAAGGTTGCQNYCYATYQCQQWELRAGMCWVLLENPGDDTCEPAGGTSYKKALPKWTVYKWTESYYYLNQSADTYTYKLTDDLPWPKARYKHEAVLKWVDGEARMYVTGGYGPRCVDFCRDTWFWDFQLKEWVMDKEPSPFNAGMALGGRWGFCMLADPNTNDIFFFGGMLRNYYLNDFNAYDVKQKQWKLLDEFVSLESDMMIDDSQDHYNVTHPITRAFHTCSWNHDYTKFFIYGGYHSTRQGLSPADAVDQSFYLNDFWGCNKALLTSNYFEGCQRHLQNNLHGPHWLKTEDNFYDYTPQRSRDSKMICIKEPLFGENAAERTQVNAQYGSDWRGEVCFVFGGYAQNHFEGDTWRYRIADENHEGETWRRFLPPVGANAENMLYAGLHHWEPRSETSVIFDDETLTFWLFGGYGPDNKACSIDPETNDTKVKCDEVSGGKWVRVDNKKDSTKPIIYYDDVWKLDLRRCPNDCGGNGECRHGYCLCDDLWWGVDCGSYYCPMSNCTSLLDRHADWWTQDCNHCLGAGTCDGIPNPNDAEGWATCECDGGYKGMACDEFFCPSTEAVPTEEDEACNVPVGECTETIGKVSKIYEGEEPTCDCGPEYRVPNCQRKKCLGEIHFEDGTMVWCNGRGDCLDDGRCECHEAEEEGKTYSGLACERLIVDPAARHAFWTSVLLTIALWLIM